MSSLLILIRGLFRRQRSAADETADSQAAVEVSDRRQLRSADSTLSLTH